MSQLLLFKYQLSGAEWKSKSHPKTYQQITNNYRGWLSVPNSIGAQLEPFTQEPAIWGECRIALGHCFAVLRDRDAEHDSHDQVWNRQKPWSNQLTNSIWPKPHFRSSVESTFFALSFAPLWGYRFQSWAPEQRRTNRETQMWLWFCFHWAHRSICSQLNQIFFFL